VAEADTNDSLTSDPGANGRGPVATWRFQVAVVRYHRLVYRVAEALLRDRAEAEDIVQEAFFRYWEQGNGVRAPREWLLAVARNLCLDRHRRARRTVSLETVTIEEPRDERTAVTELQQQELGSRLKELIAALPEPQRSLVVLFDVQGLTGEACARILGINTNQVKVYLHRARRRLRRALEGEE
jgi:RNA polymerase sigma-70 factor, ECF subfamily